MLAYLVIAGVDGEFANKLSKSRRFYYLQRLHIFHNILSHKSLHFSSRSSSRMADRKNLISVALFCLRSHLSQSLSRCRELPHCRTYIALDYYVLVLFSDELKTMEVCQSHKCRMCLCMQLNH